MFELVQSGVKDKSLQVISRLLGNKTRLCECCRHQSNKPIHLLAMLIHRTIQVDVLVQSVCCLHDGEGFAVVSLRETPLQQAKGEKQLGVYYIKCVFTGPAASRPL